MRKEVGNIRVYVAGKYNDKNIISILDNLKILLVFLKIRRRRKNEIRKRNLLR